MRRRLVFSAIAGIGVAFLASFVAFEGTHSLLTKSDQYELDIHHYTFVDELDAFRVEAGGYPIALRDLKFRERSESGKFPFLFAEDGTPCDPWGTPYVYQQIGDSYSLRSHGSDGREGGRGTAADITFPPDSDVSVYIAPMTYWEFMIDQPTTATATTSALAGLFTFLIGACGAMRQKHDDEPMEAFVAAILCVSFISVVVGGILAMWHVPIGEHH